MFKPKHINPRPSKIYLYRLFESDLRKFSQCERAADIASADLKNSHLFNSDVYYGVDIDKQVLKTGLEGVGFGKTKLYSGPISDQLMEKHDKKGFYGVQGDIRNKLFPPNSLDLITSTHTFSHINPSDYSTVINHFNQYLRPGGTLLLQLPDEQYFNNIKQELLSNFETVEVIRYRVPTSVAYERIITKFNQRSVFGKEMKRKYVFALVSLLLFQIERSGLLNGKSMYIRCIDSE